MNEMPTAEIVQPSALEAIARAEVDMSIATARRYPRQLPAVKLRMLNFATLDVETAENCFYTLPRGGKTIMGPSVRLAEIALSCYGNIKAGSRIIDTVTTGEAPHVTIQAVCMDMENNVTITIEKRRRIVGKKSKNGAIDEDDINLAANAGSAIAFRDAVFKVIPLALIKPVFDAARKVAVGDVKTLVDRRARAIESFAKMAVSKEKILAKLGKTNIEEIGLGELEILLGLHNALKDGELNVDEAFPAPESKPNFSPTVAPKPGDDGDLGPQTQAQPQRGRPPGSKNKTAPTDAQPPEPTAPAASAPAKVEEPKTVNFVKGIRGMLQIENITEGDLLEFGRVTQGFDDSLSTLEELSMVQPSKLKAIYEDWPNVARAIKAIVK